MKSPKLMAVVAALILAFITLQYFGGRAGKTTANHKQGQQDQKAGAVRSEARPEEKKGAAEQQGEEADLPVKEEIHRTYQLSPGTQIEVARFDGSVDIETTDTQTAEVHVVRSARNQTTFEKQKFVIEQRPSRLSIFTSNRPQGIWDVVTGNDELRTRVTLRLPRKSRLQLRGVNGHVNVGEFEDKVEIGGVNGRVTIVKALKKTSFYRINGPVEVSVGQLDRDGIEMFNINGPVELRFAKAVDADVEVSGLGGSFNDQGMKVVMAEERNPRNFTAKIGSGGDPIRLHRINGNVTFAMADVKAEKKAGGAAVASAR
ncbi:MAG TPA: hypothetical protein VFD58_02670 [Blastocatellia bacterium]|nr:hypothetical protein [Blastocatellia bacterium]